MLYGGYMIFIKYITLMGVFLSTTSLGITIANKYKYRVNDLSIIRNILNILKTKINYTYESLPKIFEEIEQEFSCEVGKIFKIAKEKMQEMSAGEAWHYALENAHTNMNEEDIRILKNLEKMLGKTNVEGQITEIELMEKFIDKQIEKAEEEQKKNEKLYRSLGIICGMAIVIILI